MKNFSVNEKIQKQTKKKDSCCKYFELALKTKQEKPNRHAHKARFFQSSLVFTVNQIPPALTCEI